MIYPGIDVTSLPKPLSYEERGAYYLSVGRCIPYKKFELLVDTFNENGKPLILVTNTNNKLYRKLKAKSKTNIEWKLWISREEITKLYSEAKAFVFPPEEDFWLVPLEAMASWTPVIAYWVGWALETVVHQKTGVFFEKQTPESLNETIERFETMNWDTKTIRKHAENFDKEIFKEKIEACIEEKLKS